ncbi:MAG: ABC transporter ATP-binding protein/permease [Candidatus Gastranaerophilales bacterium]|nr:ABC transporter ATP-binding protein/permease [Candidatus Gastranaerophilales bacterium]
MKVIRNCGMAFRYVFRYAPFPAVIMILSAIIPSFFIGLQVILTQRLVDQAIHYVGTGEGLQSVIVTGALLVLMLFLWVTLQKVGGYSDNVMALDLAKKMAPDTMDKLYDLEYSAFEQKGTQENLKRIGEEPWKMMGECFSHTVWAVTSVWAVFFTLGVYISISVWIGVGLVVIAAPMILLNYSSALRLHEMERENTEGNRRIGDIKRLLQNRHAMYEMKVFGSQELLSEKWKNYCGKIERDVNVAGHKLLLTKGAAILLSILYFIFIIVTLSYSLLHGTLTMGQFVAAFGSMNSVVSKLSNSTWQVTHAVQSALRLDYYREFQKMPRRKDRRNVTSVSHCDIAFENVSFTYPGTDREILRNVTFRIKAGERVAFVGENGAGKSTIVKLLCGLYEPTQGRVMIGGENVRDLTDETRRKLLTVVFQDFQGYEMTLRENVAFGDIQKISRDELLLDALKLADASDLVESEEKGLDRSLGHLTEDGKDLSKGQWQRVAMARAFLSDAAYVILDEPTASLDPVAESHMYENFSKIFAENGTIMISHRLASAKMADRIMVLDGGRIVQDGNHERLMEQEGLYRTMYLVQSAWYVQGGEANV